MRLKKNKGIALLIVLLLLSLCLVVAIQVTYDVDVDKASVEYSEATVQGFFALKNGLDLAKAVLLQDLENNAFDSSTDIWVQPRTFTLQPSNASVTFVLTDEESRNNMNMLVNQGGSRNKSIYDRFYRLFVILGFENTTEMLEQLCDYIDADDTGQYEQNAKNSRLYTIKEILNLSNFTIEKFLGDKTKEPPTKGLNNFVTIWSSGKININTAPKEVLMSIDSSITEEVADKIIEYRTSKNENGNQISFETLADVAKLELSQEATKALMMNCTVESVTFRYIGVADVNGTKKQATAFLFRNKNDRKVNLILWSEDDFVLNIQTAQTK